LGEALEVSMVSAPVTIPQEKQYKATTGSKIFPDLDVVNVVPRLVQEAFQQGTSTMLKKRRYRLASGDT
jgi:hypothetical protein